jgi:hypothetical protein
MPLPVGPNEARELEELDIDEAALEVFVNAHVNNSKRHIPTPPVTGTFFLKAVNGVLKWSTS